MPPSTSGTKTSEWWVMVVMTVIGLALMTFATLKVTDPVLQQRLLDFAQWLLAGGPTAFIVSRGLSKFGNGGAPSLPAPATDAEAAAAVAKT